MVQDSDRVRTITSEMGDTYAYVSPEAYQGKIQRLMLIHLSYKVHGVHLPSFTTVGSCSESNLDQTTDRATEIYQIWTKGVRWNSKSYETSQELSGDQGLPNVPTSAKLEPGDTYVYVSNNDQNWSEQVQMHRTIFQGPRTTTSTPESTKFGSQTAPNGQMKH